MISVCQTTRITIGPHKERGFVIENGLLNKLVKCDCCFWKLCLLYSTIPVAISVHVSTVSIAIGVWDLCCQPCRWNLCQRFPHLCCQLCLWSLLPAVSMVSAANRVHGPVTNSAYGLCCQLCPKPLLPTVRRIYVTFWIYSSCGHQCLHSLLPTVPTNIQCLFLFWYWNCIPGISIPNNTNHPARQ